MYYKSVVEGVVRVDPKLFGENLGNSILKQLKISYSGKVTEELGKVIAILKVNSIGDGFIIAGDGAAVMEDARLPVTEGDPPLSMYGGAPSVAGKNIFFYQVNREKRITSETTTSSHQAREGAGCA